MTMAYLPLHIFVFNSRAKTFPCCPDMFDNKHAPSNGYHCPHVPDKFGSIVDTKKVYG